MSSKPASKKAKILPVHEEESARLLLLFKEAGFSQEGFGAKFNIGTQGMVWQYLHAKSPLNLEAAINFARGLRCNVADFSPRLASILKLAPDIGLSSEELILLNFFREAGDETRMTMIRMANNQEIINHPATDSDPATNSELATSNFIELRGKSTGRSDKTKVR